MTFYDLKDWETRVFLQRRNEKKNVQMQFLLFFHAFRITFVVPNWSLSCFLVERTTAGRTDGLFLPCEGGAEISVHISNMTETRHRVETSHSDRTFSSLIELSSFLYLMYDGNAIGDCF